MSAFYFYSLPAISLSLHLSEFIFPNFPPYNKCVIKRQVSVAIRQLGCSIVRINQYSFSNRYIVKNEYLLMFALKTKHNWGGLIKGMLSHSSHAYTRILQPLTYVIVFHSCLAFNKQNVQ